MIIFKVTEDRFMHEYQQHIQPTHGMANVAEKYVDWYVDQDGWCNLYLLTNYGYGYFYTENVETIKNKPIFMTMTQHGEILGIVNTTPFEVVEVQKSFNPLLSLINHN